ncbi:patatin-like phospholipase family protein [Nocardioides baculatus]|uniref:Patatin-like phospholipase family protein n=1 Tax=Nocardioides baculatus TaxID=2801337 RepID=A0ABS1L916_9ACTN|nr:patatin-like phospholipase family protein [Nocardioides baculatus]MBL0748179.1 patatin-like phospholipase family protein [Nocardioides baculatus]
MTDRGTSALVLGGGGITGIAWELGILYGLAEAGVDLTGADTVVGTSAGSVVGAQLGSGLSLDDLYASQLEPPDAELGGRLSRIAALKLVPPYLLPGTGRDKLARVGRVARAAHEPGSIDREGVIRSRLPVHDWPDRDLRITAVDTESGEFTVFTRDSGVDLVSAVAASCAVPTVWPPVEIAGHTYMDGGMRSTANIDVAAGVDRLVVLAPLPRSVSKRTSIQAQVQKVAPRTWSVITPDPESLAAFGRNLLDPAKRKVAAEAGLRQSRDLVEQVRGVWSA